MADGIVFTEGNIFPPEFRYSLTYKGVTTILKSWPDTWQDFSLEWKMDPLFWGRALSLSIPTKFVKDAKRIIDQAYLEQGVNALVMFRIEKMERISETVYDYKTMYYNRLNFTSIISERDYVELESEPQGLLAILARKGDQEFEIDMTDGRVVNYDRILFNQYAKYHAVNETKLYTNLNKNFIPTIIVDETSIVTDKHGDTAIEFQSIAFMIGTDDEIISNDMYFIKCNKDVSVNIQIAIQLKFTIAWYSGGDFRPSGSVRAKICTADKTEIYATNYVSIGSSDEWPSELPYVAGGYAATANVNMNCNNRFDLKEGNKYYIIFERKDVNRSYVDFIGISTTVTLQSSTWTYRGAPKQINTITPSQLGKRLLAKITEGHSGTFDFQIPSEYDSCAITCGDAIRGTEGAKIKTTFNNLFRAYSRLFQLRMDIVENSETSETAIMKPLASFFEKEKADGSNVVDLGEVTELRMRPWLDQIVNTIKVGYEDNSYENSDGKGEFNTELQFSTPVETKRSTLDLMIPYRADSYGIEYVLIDFEKEETADGKADNDVFLMHINGSNEVVRGDWRIPNSPGITGTYADSTMFNAMLSPKSILIRNRNLISSILDSIQPIDGKNVIFGSSKKDMDVAIGNNTTGIIYERYSVMISDENLFRPIILEFYTGLRNFNAYEVMRRNPNGVFKFSFMGKNYRGFVLELQVQPTTNQKQDWQLICYPEDIQPV
jgi:hypothetical protein